jgi:hypothetical protein
LWCQSGNAESRIAAYAERAKLAQEMYEEAKDIARRCFEDAE